MPIQRIQSHGCVGEYSHGYKLPGVTLENTSDVVKVISPMRNKAIVLGTRLRSHLRRFKSNTDTQARARAQGEGGR